MLALKGLAKPAVRKRSPSTCGGCPGRHTTHGAAMSEGLLASGSRRHPPHSGTERALGHAQFLVAGSYTAPALGAVVVRSPQPQRTEHSGQVLLAVAKEHRLVALAAVDPLPSIAAVQRQQLLQERPAKTQHGGANGEFGHFQVEAPKLPVHVGEDPADQTVYLFVELRLERLLEPFFWPSATALVLPILGTGRSSQICSLMSTISSTSERNLL